MFVHQLQSATASEPITAITPYSVRDIRVILLINDVEPVCQNKFLINTYQQDDVFVFMSQAASGAEPLAQS